MEITLSFEHGAAEYNYTVGYARVYVVISPFSVQPVNLSSRRYSRVIVIGLEEYFHGLIRIRRRILARVLLHYYNSSRRFQIYFYTQAGFN